MQKTKIPFFSNKKIKLLAGSFFLLILFTFIKIYGNFGPCVPSVMMVFAEMPLELRCGSSNPNIIEIGNVKSYRLSYQPDVASFEDIYVKVTTTVTGQADVVMSFDDISVGSEVRVSGRYYTQEYYDNFDNIIASERRFIPFAPGLDDDDSDQGDGFGQADSPDFDGFDPNDGQNNPLFPNSVSNSQFYFDNTEGLNSTCSNDFSQRCLDSTYVETIEYNPDLKSIPIDDSTLVDYQQADYRSPEPIQADAGDQELELPNLGPSQPVGTSHAGSSTNKPLPPAVVQWKLQKIMDSYNNFNEAAKRSEQSTQQFEQQRNAVFDSYRQQLQAMEAHSNRLKSSYDSTLKDLNSLLEGYTPPPFQRRSNDYFSLPTQFEYNELSGQAREVLEAQLDKFLDRKNARQYAKVAEKLINSNDYELSKSKIRVNESGILNSNLFDPNGSKNSLDTMDLTKVKSAHNRELLRTVANKYQAYWAELGGLEAVSPEQILLYSIGTELLNSALGAANSENISEFLSYLDGSLAFLESAAKFNLGLASGLGNKLADKVMEIPELAMLVYEHFDKIPTTTEDWVKFSELVVRAAPQFKQAIIDGVIQYRDDFLYGDEFKKGEVVGYIIGEAIDTFVPAGRITSVTKIFQKSDDIIKLSRMADVLTPDLANTVKALTGSRRQYLDNFIIDFDNSSVEFIKNNPQKFLSNLVEVYDEDVLHTFDKLFASTRPFDTTNIGKGYDIIEAQKIFQSEDQFLQTLATVGNISQNMNLIEGVEAAGYLSRYTPKNRLSPGESALDPHMGNLVFPGRYGIGGSKGVDVLSFGYGADELSSLSVSRFEAGVTAENILDFNPGVHKGVIKNVLDLTNPGVREIMGVNTEQLISIDNILTHSIGALAQKKGFNGVLAPSAKKQDGKVIHIFGNQSL